MTKSELKKKRQQIVEQKGYKTYKQRKEEEKQQAKTIQTTNTRPISTPSATNTLNWNNVVNRANQIMEISNTLNKNATTNVDEMIKSLVNDSKNIDKTKETNYRNRQTTKQKISNQAQNNAITPITYNKDLKESKGEIEYKQAQIKKDKKKQEELKNISDKDIVGKVGTTVSHTISDIFQKPKQFYDGYQIGDVSKTAINTALGAGSRVIGGVESVANFIPQAFGYGASMISNIVGDKATAEKWKQATQQQQQEREEARNKVFDTFENSSILGNTGSQAIEGIGQSLVFGATGQANQALGNTLMFGQGFGSGLQEAYSKENVEDWQALLKATGSGATTLFTEKIFDLVGEGSTISKKFKEKILKEYSEGLSKGFAKTGLSAVGEGAEEVLESVLGTVNNKIINTITNLVGSGAKFDENFNIEEMVEGFVIGALSGGITGGGSTTSINGKNLQIPQNQATTMQNNEILQQEQQTIPNQDKTAQNQTSQETLSNGKYAIKMPNSNYKFVKSGNTKIDNLRQDANKYWNNSKDTQKLMTTLEKIMNDKDVSIRLDDKITDGQGNVVDGRYDNGVITINPNSTRAFEYIATHELTHAIGTKQMLDMVQRYRQDNQEFNSKVETLLKNYNATELTEEALADVSAQLFGTQEFIANVQNTNPNLFQKIYNEIKYLWHQFRGYKNEGQFIEDLYNKWTQAYNSKSELNQTSKNMIAGRIAMNNAISQNAQFKVIEDAYNKAVQMDSRKASNEEIRKKTNWFKDKNGHWKFRFTDKDMTLTKDVNHIVANKEYDLDKLIKHDILFELYPELKSSAENPIKVRFKNIKNSSKRGAYSPNTNVITLNTRLLNLKNAQSYIEETLIHEIQHAVQKIEGFEAGTNLKGGIKKYNENLGEIEAYDSENTFYEEKYLEKEVKRAPESSKANPKPLNLKNENIFDTIISSISDFFSKENASYEQSIDVLEEIEKKNNSRNRNLVENGINKNQGLEESSSFNLQKNKITRSIKELQEVASNMENSFLTRVKAEYELSALENGFDNTDDYTAWKNKQREQELKEYEERKRKEKEEEEAKQKKKQEKLQREIEEATPLKRKQYEIIQKTNPMFDDYHVGIRSPADIKTFEEAIQDDESFKWGDFNIDDAKKALKNNKITIYSSYPIKQGVFVSTSKVQAEQYAGRVGNRVYSKTVPLKNVAWINGDEGQYANTSTKYSKQNAEWQEYLEEHFNTEGTRTYGSQIKNGLPQASVLRQNVTNSKKYTTKKETDTEIAKILDTPVTKQKPKDRTWAIIKANILDKGIVFEDLSKRAKNRELEAKWDYTLTSGARAQNAIGNKRYDLSGNVISKGLTEIMDEVGDKINDFQNYMYHQLNVDRMTLKDRLAIDNKPVFGDKIGADYSQRKIAEYEKSNPKFKEWAKDVYDYLKADKAELVKNGVISEELSRKFEELYPHYVPIQRADKLGNAINVPLDTRRTGINTPIKKAKGGSSDINPLFQTMANRTMQTYRASARNSLGVELKNTLQKLNEFKANESNIEDLDNIIETVSNEAQTDELLKASKDGRLPTFTVFQNGEKVTFDISEDIYDALKPTSEALKGMWLKGIPNKISNLRRAVLTEYNPLFSITNTIKDTQDVLLNSQHATKTYLKYPEAYTQILNKGFWYNEYIQNGGGQNTYFKDGDFEVKKTGKLPKAKEIVTFPLEAISKVNNALEMAPRLAEYIASREEGRSIQTSMLDASRVTTNFKAGGDFTKALNRNGATFLNAGVQGTMQAVRNIREANQQGLKGWTVLACKLAVAGAPVWILNNLMWEDDEEYEQLQDYVKDGYYIVGKRDDGTFIRIPKGRTLASIQKVVSNVDKYMNNKEELNIDNVAQDFWETLKFGVENIAPNNPIDNNVASPLVQVATNTSWYGEDIVPERLQNVPKAEQFDETTDKFSKWLGEKLNVSPMKINYLLDQYGGGISDVLLPLGTPQAENTPLEDKFVTDPVMKSKYPGEFFEKADKIDIASNSMYATDTDIVKGKYMSYIQGNISDLYKEKREIQNSTYSDTAKKEKLKEVQKQINQTAKMAIEDVENAKVTSTTAIIGAEGFYKDSDGEWKRIKEEDRISNLRIQSYSDYKVKKEEATDKKRKEKGNDKATLNDSEIIEIIKNSNYTDKEKDALFDDQINDKTYKNLKLLNKNNISKINQYMDYKTADLDSDKKDDGTKKGKTIYGSKEKKITTYLNNSSFDDVERIYLYGQTYKLDNEQRKKLTNAIKKAGLTSEEQKQIYLDLASSNVEELSDGRIRWK